MSNTWVPLASDELRTLPSRRCKEGQTGKEVSQKIAEALGAIVSTGSVVVVRDVCFGQHPEAAYGILSKPSCSAK